MARCLQPASGSKNDAEMRKTWLVTRTGHLIRGFEVYDSCFGYLV
jgi:hypothetical protein